MCTLFDNLAIWLCKTLKKVQYLSMLLDKYYKVSKYKQMISFPWYISLNGRSIAPFQRRGGRGRGGAVRSLYAGNVVIPMIIFFWSFHNDTSVVWISKTVSIDATYLKQLETFLIHFDEGRGTCIRSPEGSQLFPRKYKKKIHDEMSEIY